MENKLVLIIGILVLSLLFTACDSSMVTPSDTTVTDVPTLKKAATQEENDSAGQKTGFQEADNITAEPIETSQTPSNYETNANQKENVSEPEDDQVTTNDNDDFDAIIGEEQPAFTTESGFRSWLLSTDTTVFKEQKDIYLSAMTSGNSIQYYCPVVTESNALVTLQKIRVFGSSVTHIYTFNDEAYSGMLFRITNYTGNRKDYFKDVYDTAMAEIDKGTEGYSLLENNGTEIACYEKYSFNTISYYWYQHGGYQIATIMGDGQLPPITYLLSLINLEQVTLRTDTVTQ